jgi:two-component system, cell cycle response regulator DivK
LASKLTVLVVDDNERNVKLACAVLEAAGFSAPSAASGTEALELAAVRRLDLVLLDVRLPDIDGPEVARRLRADPQTAGLPIVALTSLGPDEAAGLLELGFDGYLEKPIDVRSFPSDVRAFAAAGPGASAADGGGLPP